MLALLRILCLFLLLLSVSLASAHRNGKHAELAVHGPGHGAALKAGSAFLNPGGGGEGLLSVDVQMRQVPTKVEHESFLERLQASVTQFVVGLVLITFSFPVLWFNESRNAAMETVIGRGKSQCRDASGKTAEIENRNWLVHLEGEPMRAIAPVKDPQFDVALQSGCVRLQSVVEVFQYVEHESKEEKEKPGGGKDVITTYSYTTEWSTSWNDSGNFQDRSKSNSKPTGLDLGRHSTECSHVEFGEAFVLPEELIVQCTEFTSAEPQLNDSVKHRSGTSFEKRGDNHFYYHVDGQMARHEAKIGDARVRFMYVPDGPVSVLALQAEKSGEAKDSFLPYRLVSRGWCGTSEEEEKLLLRKRAELSAADLAAESQVGSGGCLWCLCCACNLVTMFFSAVTTPEIHHLFHGRKDKHECFGVLEQNTQRLVWSLRLVGWSMMFVGLFSLFSPFLTFIKVIPWLGPLLSKLGGTLIWVVCFLVTVSVASVIICLAYLVHHPLKALLYSAVAAAAIAVPLALLQAFA